MGRVTVREFYNDISDINIEDLEEYEKVKHIEIVPRRAIEMIIKRCEWAMAFYSQDTEFARGKRTAADDIRAYAEFLLMEFEEDE